MKRAPFVPSLSKHERSPFDRLRVNGRLALSLIFLSVLFSVSVARAAEQTEVIERDLDKDGRPEVKIFMKGGKAERSEVDRNGDGKPDLVRFMKEGRPEREQADLNFDGKPDAWNYYKEGVKEFTIMDKNFDGKPDAWFYYGQAGLKLVGGRVDEDFDGKPDKSFGVLPEKEERRPW